MGVSTYTGPDPMRPLPPEQDARREQALNLAAAAAADARENIRRRMLAAEAAAPLRRGA